MDKVDVVVAGAGVIGLACARALALAGRQVLVLDQEPGIGRGISARNSEVVHRGLYYRTGSYKDLHCRVGRRMLFRYCAERGIPRRRCGKLIVATSEAQLPALAALHASAQANGVDDLVALTGTQAMAREPELRCVGALWSPGSGIVDAHALMLSLQADLEAAGGVCVFNTVIDRAEVGQDRTVHTRHLATGETWSLRCRWLINAAGLGAQALAARMQGFPQGRVPELHLAKGSYFALSTPSPFERLVYPLPEPGGLGIHLTLDMAGRARFGPDVEWVEQPDYHVDPARAPAFYRAIRRYWPGLPEGALQPAYAGVRPKLRQAGGGDSDFRILGPAEHGVEGVVQLFGIESPGLTASLSLGSHVAAVVTTGEAASAGVRGARVEGATLLARATPRGPALERRPP